MHVPRFQFSMRRSGSTLAVGSILLLGCARKVQIEVPANFHGHVQILCTGLSDDRSITLHVDATGQATAATCPVRQTDTVVTRDGMAGPVETSVMWTTTGDGLVREIAFDVR
jgi:hypothetical protein